MTLARAALCLALGLLAAGAPTAQTSGSGGDGERWLTVDYGALVDRRELSHSGESVGALLGRLGGRALPPAGERAADRTAHSLLEPLLEPYAFVLADVLDARGTIDGAAPLIEVGRLWGAGEAQPAWAELLRARRYLIESDGRGRIRACLPLPADAGEATAITPGESARLAWRAAWPVLRHVFEAERRRLGGVPPGSAAERDLPELVVDVHAYAHHPQRTAFTLAATPLTLRVDDTRASGIRPPLDLARLERFLDAGLRLEGARVERDGSLRLFGSQPPDGGRSTLLGRPLAAADVAVAWRAVARGGLAEPYMSLDRGYAPQRSLVTYGGRLRDTTLGMVSLLCDIRFKTFSMGLDIVEGRDLRDELRARLASFATHLERMARDARSARSSAQQTRLWFYPDAVDLTLSPQGDLLALRRVRMSAASERVEIGSSTGRGGEDPPWTRATVDAINNEYDTLATFFPEMADLDQVVRLLALSTWLAEAGAAGAPVPDLDTLLALELPPLITPRSFPQMLAFNGLPPAGTTAEVAVVDRVPVVEALDRLDATGAARPPALRRFRRALAGLDPNRPDNAKLLAELRALDPGSLDDDWLDFHAYRAERLRMHRLSLSTLPVEDKRRLRARPDASTLRVFSVAIGGLDLGMGQVLQRARAGRAAAAGESPSASTRAAVAPREAWRAPAVVRVAMPAHDASGGARLRVADEMVAGEGERRVRRVRLAYGADGPEPSVRTVGFDTAGRPVRFERHESARRVAYRFEVDGPAVAARRIDPAPAARDEPAPSRDAPPPSGLALLTIRRPDAAVRSGAAPEPPEVGLRVFGAGAAEAVDAAVPRAIAQRLVLGRDADPTPRVPLDGFDPPPPPFETAEAVMVLVGAESRRPPWERAATPPPAGEEDPWRVARALDRWWHGPGASRDVERPRAVLGCEADRSPDRWAATPSIGDDALLWLLVDDASATEWSAAWPSGRVRTDATTAPGSVPLVIVADESPDAFGARLVSLARAGALRGRVVAVWSLAGPVRPDVVASLIVDGGAAAVGVGDRTIVERRAVGETLAAVARAVSGGARRPETLPGPWLWVY